jgi:hypothetical protein
LRWPQDASGSAQSLVPRGGGREKDSRSVQSTASEALVSLNWPGMDASSKASQMCWREAAGSPSGSSLPAAAATRPKVYSVCRQVSRCGPFFQSAVTPSRRWSSPGRLVRAWCTRVRWAAR